MVKSPHQEDPQVPQDSISLPPISTHRHGSLPRPGLELVVLWPPAPGGAGRARVQSENGVLPSNSYDSYDRRMSSCCSGTPRELSIQASKPIWSGQCKPSKRVQPSKLRSPWLNTPGDPAAPGRAGRMSGACAVDLHCTCCWWIFASRP